MSKRRKNKRTKKVGLLTILKGSVVCILSCTVATLLYLKITKTNVTSDMLNSILSIFVAYVIIALLTTIVYNVFASKTLQIQVNNLSVSQVLDILLYLTLCIILYVMGLLIPLKILLLITGWTPLQ